MQNQRISVIIPTYNRAGQIAASINSVLAQTYRDFEIVIVDDGSSDDTEARVTALSDDRIRYHRLPKNGGASNARNQGVKLASCDLIAFHDSDDLWHPDKLEKQMAYWEKHPEDVLVYCALEYRDPDSGEMVSFPFSDIPRDSLHGDIYRTLLTRNTMDTPTILMRKDIFNQAGGFDPLYPPLEDWELNLRIAKLGTVGYVDEPLITSGITEGSLSSSTSAYYRARCRIFADYIDDIKRLGMFDQIAGDILRHAEKDGVLESVKKMMMLQLMEKRGET
ncbi:MAG: glycosyltransferase [Lachnospiraceae bacterium]|nr:glycosyltransferase [Lachnospiraceae bacterium]